LEPHARMCGNGTCVAIACCDGTVQIRSIATAALLATLQGHTDLVWAFAFSADGRSLATASLDGTARVWDVATGNCQGTFTHEAPVDVVSLDEHGTRLATACGDERALVWDVASGGCAATLAHAGRVTALCLSHSQLASADAANIPPDSQ